MAEVEESEQLSGGQASAQLSGRRRQAARNDQAILAAAREVFLADPKAPISAVAERAGVGISALYRRYPGKEDLLRTLCRDGLRRFVVEAEAGVRDPDGWNGFTEFLRRIVDADVHSLTVRLAGSFAPSQEMAADVRRSGELTTSLVERAHASGRLRAGVVPADVGLLLECCAEIRHPDAGRAGELRRRYLALLIDGLATTGTELPGPAPRVGEFGFRWQR